MIRKNEDPKSTRNTGGWTGEVSKALEDLLQGAVGDSPVAVFDFDNTCIRGDIGELYGHYLVETMRYRYDLDDFWRLIHVDDGRERLRRLTDAAMAIPPEERAGSPVYRDYLAEMAGLYGRRLRRAGKRDCYEWAVRLHVGLTTRQMNAWSAEAIRRELAEARRVERFETSRGRLVEVERGVRPYREMRQLIAALGEAGFEVWIVSATNAWTVRQFAPFFGVPRKRVLGNLVEVDGERLTATTRPPALFREGKVEIIEREIGRRPAFVAGDSVTDYEMLCRASELALVVDCGDQKLRHEARQRGWAVQPRDDLSLDEVDPGEVDLGAEACDE